MDRVLINGTGQILKSSTGAILKERAYNEMVLQDGLEFWGAADPAFLTIDLGLVSEAYDIRGNGNKMIQATASKRPTYSNGSIVSNSAIQLQLYTQISYYYRSAFIVGDFLNSGTSNRAIGIGNTILLGRNLNNGVGIWNSGVYFGQFYRNNVKYNAAHLQAGATAIYHSLTDLNANSIVYVGNTSGSGAGTYYIKEWGFYNRVLSEQETIYNINALNSKYGIF